MNKIERMIHARVADHPQLRIPLVAAYQRLLSILPRDNYLSDHPMKVGVGMFFGFHDKCPWSFDEQVLLAHKFDVDADWDRVEQGPIQVGVVDPRSLTFHPLGATWAWNWQQGAMLQWVGSDGLVLYNDIRDGLAVSRLVSTEGKMVAELPGHVACVSPDGRHALGYRFERMRYAAPEYAYRLGSHAAEHERCPTDDGLTLLDLRSGRSHLVHSLEAIAHFRPLHSMRGAYHYFSHTLFSPRGRRVAFFHRWIGKDRILHTRLFSCDPDGGRLYLFPVTHASHIGWKDDDWLLATCKPTGREFGYYLMKPGTDEIEKLGPTVLVCDGHPQFSCDGRYVLTDTYPDRKRMQSLLVYDTETTRRHLLASFRIGFRFRYERRCDYHPR